MSERSAKELTGARFGRKLVHAKEQYFDHATHSTRNYYVAKRPHMDALLDSLSDKYDFFVWSNNGQPYIDEILEAVWPKKHPLVGIFTSSESKGRPENGMLIPFFKEIKKIAKRYPQYSKDRILAVDDLPHVHCQNYGNLVAVTPFIGIPDDELLKLSEFLLSIHNRTSLKAVEKRY